MNNAIETITSARVKPASPVRWLACSRRRAELAQRLAQWLAQRLAQREKVPTGPVMSVRFIDGLMSTPP
ncbi:MAG: hypothetical protein ACJ74U_08475 [Jatrophihabitantaceae bacterium]